MRLTGRDEKGVYYRHGIESGLQQYADRPPHDCKEAIERLAAYEDTEEQGLMVRLPTVLGETVKTKYGVGTVVAWDTTARIRLNDEPDFAKKYRDYDIGSKIFTHAAALAALGVK